MLRRGVDSVTYGAKWMNICDDDDFCVFLTIFVRAEDDDVSICPDEREREKVF